LRNIINTGIDTSTVNIGVTGPDIFSSYGGAQTHTINIIKILNNYFNIVYLPSPEIYNKSKKEVLIQKAYELENQDIKITKYFYEVNSNRYNYDEIIDIYSREKLDILIDFDYMYNAIFSKNYTEILSERTGVKYINVLQGLGDLNFGNTAKYVYDTIKLSKNYRILLFRIYQYVNRQALKRNIAKQKNLVAVAIINKNYQENFTMQFDNIKVLKIGNGIWNSNINLIKYTQNAKKDYIIYFARLNYTKGIFEIPVILKNILRYCNTKLVIVGNFTREVEKSQFIKMVKKYKLEDNIILKGYLTNDQLYDEISKSKLMIYPSHSDSFSLAISQALALYTPVIAYNIAGVKIYENFKAVKLVNEFDYKAMANEAVKILKMNDVNRLFDDNMTDFINEHNWNSVAMEYKSIIEKYN